LLLLDSVTTYAPTGGNQLLWQGKAAKHAGRGPWHWRLMELPCRCRSEATSWKLYCDCERYFLEAAWRGDELPHRTMMQAVYINLEENEEMQSLSRLERYTL